jgi:hypothetical protein
MNLELSMQFENLTALYHFLDEQVTQDVSGDDLFAGSYLRGFISLASSEYGDESQVLTQRLAINITEKLQVARTELTPQDHQIVQDYWLGLKTAFTA